MAYSFGKQHGGGKKLFYFHINFTAMRYYYLLLACAMTAASCEFVGGERIRGNGNVLSTDRSVSSFNGVNSAGFFDVYLSTGADYSLRLEGEENILEYIETYVEGNTLHIRTRDGYNLKTRRDVNIYITAPDYRSVSLRGSGDINSQDKLRNSSSIELSVAGSGDIDVDLDAPKIRTELSGSGDIELSGDTRDFSASIRGSGDIDAFDLRSENTDISISGSGNANVFASMKLNVEVRGSGNVRYKGGASVTSDIRGSGDVRKAN